MMFKHYKLEAYSWHETSIAPVVDDNGIKTLTFAFHDYTSDIEV